MIHSGVSKNKDSQAGNIPVYILILYVLSQRSGDMALTISTSHTEPLGSCKSTMLLGDHKDKGLYEFSIGLYAIVSDLSLQFYL